MYSSLAASLRSAQLAAALFRPFKAACGCLALAIPPALLGYASKIKTCPLRRTGTAAAFSRKL